MIVDCTSMDGRLLLKGNDASDKSYTHTGTNTKCCPCRRCSCQNVGPDREGGDGFGDKTQDVGPDMYRVTCGGGLSIKRRSFKNQQPTRP
jgi:hypothetical protein